MQSFHAEIVKDANTVMVLYAKQSDYEYYDSAEAWPSSIGSGWRLPNLDELKIIVNNRVKHNALLSTISGDEIGENTKYWSSTTFWSTYYVRSGHIRYSYSSGEIKDPKEDFFGNGVARAVRAL